MTREPLPGRPEDVPVQEPAPSPKTVTDVDDALLCEAQLLLGMITEHDTVNLALATLIAEQRRIQAVQAQIRRYQAGQFARLPHHPAGRP